MKISNAGDLRTVYLQAFNEFAIVPTDVADWTDGRINTRYARELLGTLVHHGFLCESEGDNGMVWQVLNPGTYDDHTEQEAAAVIDAWLGNSTNKENSKMSTATATPEAPTAPATHDCYCGCKEQVPAKSFYRPGHDARHAGVLGRAAASMDVDANGYSDRFSDLPSESLVAKAKGIESNQRVKNDAKFERERIAQAKKDAKNAPEFVDGIVTVGKNERMARKAKDGTVEYMDPKSEEWKTASKAATASFVEA